MALERSDPLPAFNFEVEIDGLLVGSFKEASVIGPETEIEEYAEGGVNDFVHKLVKTTKYTNLILRKGITSSTVLYDWYKQVVTGNIEMRRVTITLLDSQKTAKRSWSYKNCFPISWKGPELKADDNSIGIEEVQFVHQGLIWP